VQQPVLNDVCVEGENLQGLQPGQPEEEEGFEWRKYQGAGGQLQNCSLEESAVSPPLRSPGD